MSSHTLERRTNGDATVAESTHAQEPHDPEAARLARLISPEPESVGEFFHDQIGIKKRFKKLRSFRDTRRQVKRGEYLFDLPADELKRRGLMGPFTFNLYQSTFAALPTLLFTQVMDFFLPVEAPPPPGRPGNAVSAAVWRIMPEVEQYVQPFFVPVSFMAIAVVISWACIRGKEPGVISITSEGLKALPPSRRRGRDAFLYYDAAYGLVPQALLALALAVIPGLVGRGLLFRQTPLSDGSEGQFAVDPVTMTVCLAAAATFFVVVVYSGYLTYYKFPKLLFTVNGYYEASGADGAARAKPPWRKYILSAIFLVPLTVYGLTFLFVGVVLVITMLLAGGSAVLRPDETNWIPPPPGP